MRAGRSERRGRAFKRVTYQPACGQSEETKNPVRRFFSILGPGLFGAGIAMFVL
jgi:hypothetical protein